MSTKRMEESLPEIPLTYEGYKAIHKHIFQDVHWAGKPRTVSLANGGTFFGPPEHVDSEMKKRFDAIAKENKGTSQGGFCQTCRRTYRRNQRHPPVPRRQWAGATPVSQNPRAAGRPQARPATHQAGTLAPRFHSRGSWQARRHGKSNPWRHR